MKLAICVPREMASALFSNWLAYILLFVESDDIHKAPDVVSIFPFMVLPKTKLFDDRPSNIPVLPFTIVLFEIVLYELKEVI
jgi:hypothetical protein